MIAPYNKKTLPYGGSFSIQDNDVINFIKTIDLTESLWKDDIVKFFCETYSQWILKSKNNTVSGLENFKYPVYSNGTSQTFDMFYIKNHKKRFRCFKGEYIYHQLAWRNNWSDWKFIEDDDLRPGDAVIISLPFSDTGNAHIETNRVLKICDFLNIPVLIDCVFFGCCSNVIFDFNHDCITDVVFSLSKTFPVAHARIGMRFTRTDDDDLMSVYHKINYNNRLSAKLGLELIKKFTPDHIYNKYVIQQLELCKNLNVVPSNTVLFGLDHNNLYPEYNRGSFTNRLGLFNHYAV
jgi:hypothetical protein